MEVVKRSRKYFSYDEIIETAEIPFKNSSADSTTVLGKDDETLKTTLEDFFYFLKAIAEDTKKEEILQS